MTGFLVNRSKTNVPCFKPIISSEEKAITTTVSSTGESTGIIIATPMAITLNSGEIGLKKLPALPFPWKKRRKTKQKEKKTFTK